MKKNKDNKYTNYLLILLSLVLLGVIGYKIFENYNVKHIIFEEQKVVRVKVEISEMELFYKLNFTEESDMVKALTVRNMLREYEDPENEGFKGNVHFTIYDEDGRERYDEFNDIFIDDFVWELLDLNNAKLQYIDVLNLKPENVASIHIINPYTKETFDVNNTKDDVADYSGVEIVDSFVLALKKDIMDNPYYFNDAKYEYKIEIEADKNYEASICKNYLNTIGIIDKVYPEVKLGIDDLKEIEITRDNVSVILLEEDFEEAKEAVESAIDSYVPYTDIDSEMTIKFVFKDELELKDKFGSIHKGDVSESIYDLFE